MKKLILFSLILILTLSCISCQKACTHEWTEATVDAPKTCNLCRITDGYKLIKIPDIIGLDEASAKNILTNKGIIPKIEYEYSDEQPENMVFATYPKIGKGIEPDDVIKIYISLGPRFYY